MMRNRITEPWREVSWDNAIARVADEFRRIQETHGAERRRHHLVALHRRRNLFDAEAGALRLPQQQHRYLCPRLPLADRVRV